MPRVFYLDTGPLGLACYFQPQHTDEAAKFQGWLKAVLLNRSHVVVPAMADYELRRELIRNNFSNSIAQLDLIESGQHLDFPGVEYLNVTDPAIKRAANMWAEARNRGYATAHDKALDGDLIIAAQALDHAAPASRFALVTTNVKDLARYVGRRARPWNAITP